jgi:TonB-linked SusC/RagA family outer membrane protein
MSRLSRALAALVLSAIATLPPSARAQAPATGRITGVVLDSASGQPLGSVQVFVTGTKLGSSTTESGRFTIAGVPVGTHALETRRVGYRGGRLANVAVTAGGTTDVTIRVSTIALTLEAVITTGVVDPTSGTRVPFTVGRVNADELPVPATNAVESIQGKVAGVSITPTGQPGSGTNILLRSPTSISKSTAPLIVVDGVILSQSFDASTADLESMDIESVEIVKGAAAASLYGSRASAGVIQIRTKRGNDLPSGETKIVVRSEVGDNALAGKIDWARYHYYRTDAAGNYVDTLGVVVPRTQRVAKLAYERFQDTPYKDPIYDQVDRFFHPGQFFKNSATVSQNAGKTNWLLSFVNSKQGGVVLNSGAYDQNDVRLNLDHRLRDNLRLSVSGYHSESDRQNIYGDTFFDLINQAPDVNLLVPDPDGTPYLFQGDPEGREENPLYVISTEDRTRKRARTQGSMESRFSPFDWLSFDGNVSYDRSDRRTDYFLDAGIKTEGFGSPAGGPGEMSQSLGTTNALNAAIGTNLIGKFGDLTLRSTLRALMERENNEVTSTSGTGFVTPGVPSLSNLKDRLSSSSVEEIRSSGEIGSVGADYQGKYIVDGLIRRDGSSLFGPEERYKVYHRFSGAYRVSQESWWPFAAINEFKLRASQGTAGGRPEFEDQYETFNFTPGGGIEKNTLGNKFLKPEQAKETELGVDMIIKERYSLQLSYAKNKVVDQLLLVPLSAGVGYQSQWRNAGTVEGNTVEGTFEAQMVRNKNVSWRMGIVADRSRSKITEFDLPCFTTNSIGFRCQGESLGSMYGFSFLKDASQLPAGAQAQAGEFQRNDEGILVWTGAGNSYTDGETKKLWGKTAVIGGTTYNWGMPITLKDETGAAKVVHIGDGMPDFHFGVSNNVSWKDFSFYGLVDVQHGGQVYNQTMQRMFQYGRSGAVDQAGKPQELKKTVDYYVALYSAADPTDYFVQPGGYVKLRELSVRYNLGSKFLGAINRTGARNITLGLVGRNLLTWTRYKGYDPEVSDSDFPSTIKLDSFGYPRYRTITGSVQIEF